MFKVVKCKWADMVEGKFNLVEPLLKGDALTHWMEFNPVQFTHISKNPDGTDAPPKGICPDTFK
eukprot:9173675-Ditylum_brightwellii.AAC.1